MYSGYKIDDIVVGDRVISVYEDEEGTVLSVSSPSGEIQNYYEVEWDHGGVSVSPREDLVLIKEER